jgi:hypothetical protein
MIHHEFSRASEDLVIHCERCADGESSVARGGLDVNALERGMVEYFSIGDAIERHAARKA